MKKYIYCETNRLIKNHNYMYSEYGGVKFLELYEENRNELISFYETQINKNKNIISKKDFAVLMKLKNISEIYFSNLKNQYQISKLKNLFFRCEQSYLYEDELVNYDKYNLNTKEKLYELIINFSFNNIEKEHKLIIYKILKKFEISKKLYQSYKLDSYKPKGNFHDLKIYWLTSIALLIYYMRDHELQYLNSALKISDTLCSQDRKNLAKEFRGNAHSIPLLIETMIIEKLKFYR